MVNTDAVVYLLKFKFNKLQFNLHNEVNQFQQGYFGKPVSTSTTRVLIPISTRG